jgi:hypothetical protein
MTRSTENIQPKREIIARTISALVLSLFFGMFLSAISLSFDYMGTYLTVFVSLFLCPFIICMIAPRRLPLWGIVANLILLLCLAVQVELKAKAVGASTLSSYRNDLSGVLFILGFGMGLGLLSSLFAKALLKMRKRAQ